MSSKAGIFAWVLVGVASADCFRPIYHQNKPKDSDNTTATGITLTTDGARCLDGTYPMIYVRPGIDDDASKFVIYFEGGGWCANYEGDTDGCQDTCLHRSTTHLGSSSTYEPYVTLSGNIWGGFRSTWTQVYYRYCDGSSWSSDLTDPVSVTNSSSGVTTNLYFRGFSNLKAMMTELTTNHGLDSATEVLVSGCSAGGLSSFLHGDWIIDQVKKVSSNNDIRSGIAPDSGYFMDYETDSGEYVTSMQWVYNRNTTESLPQGCVNAYSDSNDVWKCIFAPNVAPYLKSRLFPIQSQYDSWQSKCILESKDDTAMNNYGQYLSESFVNNVITNENNPGNGAFLSSCYEHCGPWNEVIIDGMNEDEAMKQWFYSSDSNDNFHYQNEVYPCDECCGDT